MLTIFTPTYNRVNLLNRVYESLKNQTCKDFVWLIVDDGSSDGTGEQVKRWRQEGAFPIRYHYQENGGKMRAHNRGASLCDTELFVCLDSDDYFTEDAVEKIISCYREKIAGSGKEERYAGIAAHKGESAKLTLYNAAFPDIGEAALSDLYRLGFHGETTLVFRSKVLKRFPFPEIPGEKYVPEDYVYDKIDREHVFFLLPEILTVCEIVKEGYTDNVRKLREDNPQAWYLYYEQRAGSEKPSLLKLKYVSHLIRFCEAAGKNFWKDTAVGRGWLLLGLPGALLLKLAGRK